jgi:hypothetical protein
MTGLRSQPSLPMTLGNIQSLGVRSRVVHRGELCRHATTLDVDAYPDDAPVLAFGPRMVCTCCGIIGADARPNWREQPERPSLTVGAMAKLSMPAEAAKALSVRERVLLFCAASGTDWVHAGHHRQDRHRDGRQGAPHRGFLLWRLSDDGPRCSWHLLKWGRHPKPYTK